MSDEKPCVLVIGGTRGIGRAAALALAPRWRVVITGRRESQQSREALEALRAVDSSASALYFDVTDREASREALQAWTASQGAPWGVVFCAGITRDGPLAGMPPEDWDDVLAVDLGGFYNVMQPLTLPMAKKRQGRIVVVSSVSGLVGTRGQTNYSAAKAGLIAAAKALGAELASRGITVNAVAPGLIDTDMATPEDRERILPLIPMRRLGHPEEVAAAIRFLLSPEASYITRAVIPVAGGLI